MSPLRQEKQTGEINTNYVGETQLKEKITQRDYSLVYSYKSDI